MNRLSRPTAYGRFLCWINTINCLYFVIKLFDHLHLCQTCDKLKQVSNVPRDIWLKDEYARDVEVDSTFINSLISPPSLRAHGALRPLMSYNFSTGRVYYVRVRNAPVLNNRKVVRYVARRSVVVVGWHVVAETELPNRRLSTRNHNHINLCRNYYFILLYIGTAAYVYCAALGWLDISQRLFHISFCI